MELKMLLNKTEYLYLNELKGVQLGLNELENGEGFPHLKKLHIQNGNIVVQVSFL